MKIYQHLQDNVPVGWEKEFEESDEGILQACQLIEKDNVQYLPPAQYTFEAFRLTSKLDVKVVIVGQGPYHNIGAAHGLSFSCLNGIQPSLQTIYQELARSIPGFKKPDHGNLSSWARQGVLLLNICLVTQTGRDDYRLKAWMDIVESTVVGLTNQSKHIVWMMFGAKAQELGKLIGGKGVKLPAGHPSPKNASGGFVGSNVFVKCNDSLVKNGLEPIDWSL